MAVSSHPCFSRLICWFHEIHSPLFSHFSPSLFIAGFIYMSRALLVLACQSVVAEPGAGEGISGKARSTQPLAMATSCPARGRQVGSPPCQGDELEPNSAPNPPDPHKCLVPFSAGHSTAVPMGCSSPWSWHFPAPYSQLELLLQQCFADLSQSQGYATDPEMPLPSTQPRPAEPTMPG